MNDECIPKPWARYLAKMVDYNLFGLPIFLFSSWLANCINITLGAFNEKPWGIVTLISIFLVTIVESIWLGIFTSTPGKSLMGIKIGHTAQHSLVPMNMEESVERSLRCWFFGLGLGIPIVSLFTMFHNMRRIKENKMTSWDEKLNVEVFYSDNEWFRYAIAACLAMAPIFFLCII